MRGMLFDLKSLDGVRIIEEAGEASAKKVPRKNNRRCGLQRAVETDIILPMC